MTRVLITRPEPGATRTLITLLTRGINAVSIPLTEIQPLAFKTPESNFDALIVTSQNAVLHSASVLAQHISKPVFVVGRRTAEALKGLGYLHIEWAETAQKLLPLIIAHRPKSALYICGQTRRPETEIGLNEENIQCQALEVYGAARTESVPGELIAFFLGNPNPIIVFHAPSAAEAFILAMNGHPLPVSGRFLCMSAAISAQLPENWQASVTLADNPDDAAMFAQLDKMLA